MHCKLGQADNCGNSSFVSLDISLFITDPRNLFGAGSSFNFRRVSVFAAASTGLRTLVKSRLERVRFIGHFVLNLWSRNA